MYVSVCFIIWVSRSFLLLKISSRACWKVCISMWPHSRSVLLERCLNVCGSVYGSAAESADGLSVECVGVFFSFFLVLKWFCAF